MENTIAERVRTLRLKYRLSLNEFAKRCYLSHVAIQNIENGTATLPRVDTINMIAEIYGTTDQWLRFGEGEMLPNGMLVLPSLTKDGRKVDPFREALVIQIKEENNMLREQLKSLVQTVSVLSSKVPNFRKALDIAGGKYKYLPGIQFPHSGANVAIN